MCTLIICRLLKEHPTLAGAELLCRTHSRFVGFQVFVACLFDPSSIENSWRPRGFSTSKHPSEDLRAHGFESPQTESTGDELITESLPSVIATSSVAPPLNQQIFLFTG